jgi:hypothetical protein
MTNENSLGQNLFTWTFVVSPVRWLLEVLLFCAETSFDNGDPKYELKNLTQRIIKGKDRYVMG